MLALILAAFELSGAWATSTVGPPVLKDVNGVTLSVGQTVKIVGVITALSPTNGHGLEVQILPNNPSSNVPAQIYHGYDGGPQSPTPGRPVILCAALNTVVGS